MKRIPVLLLALLLGCTSYAYRFEVMSASDNGQTMVRQSWEVRGKRMVGDWPAHIRRLMAMEKEALAETREAPKPRVLPPKARGY